MKRIALFVNESLVLKWEAYSLMNCPEWSKNCTCVFPSDFVLHILEMREINILHKSPSLFSFLAALLSQSLNPVSPSTFPTYIVLL